VIGVLKHPTEDQWAKFWGVFLIVQVCLLVASTFWLGIGGVRDTLRLFAGIKAEQADDTDTGEVRHNNH
ncbi:MAG TPA: hypothetical protein VF258_08375, partial [Luteolibacter sp.]